jgi:hypothetical protein
VCGFCTRTDIVREHLEDNLRICDVSAKGLLLRPRFVLSLKPNAEADNTNRGLNNSSYPARTEFK